MAAEVRTPDPATLVWMAEHREFLRDSGARLNDPAWLGRLVDGYMACWHAAPEAERWDPAATTAAAGICAGDIAIATTPGLAWAWQPGAERLVLVSTATGAAESPLLAAAAIWAAGRPGRLAELPAALARRLTEQGPGLSEPGERLVDGVGQVPAQRQPVTRRELREARTDVQRAAS